MNEETKIIIKHKLINSSKKLFKEESDERDQANRMTYILGAGRLLLLLFQHDGFDDKATMQLFDELDLNKISL